MADVLAEFGGTSLGDVRLDERLRRTVSLAATDPVQSFPEQMGSVADREALYGFLANPKVTLGGVLVGHVRQRGNGCGGARLFGSYMTPLRFGFWVTATGWAFSAAEPRAFSGMSPWLGRPTRRANRWG